MNPPTLLPESSHFPVMLEEVINICSPDKGGIYIDCTFGGGGYSKKLLNFSNRFTPNKGMFKMMGKLHL